MPAALYWPERAVFIRVGPLTERWKCPFRQALAAEIKGDLAIIGGLVKRIEPDDYRDVVWAIAEAGFRPAKWRAAWGEDAPPRLLQIPRRRSR